MRLDTITNAGESDITLDYTMFVNTDNNYIVIAPNDEYGNSSPYALYLSGIGAFNYKLLYRTNDPTNQTTVDYLEAGDLLRILNVPDKFDGYIIAQ